MATSHHHQHENHNPLRNLSFLKWGDESHANSLHRTRHPTTDHPLPPMTLPDQHRRLSISSPLESREDVYDGVERSSARRRFDFEEKGIRIEDGQVDEMEEEGRAEGEELQKLWNLRPRKTGNQIGASLKVAAISHGETLTTEDTASKSLRLRDGGVEKKKKKKTEERARLWISLSKEEIEEDIFIITGSRPVRRPKRRPKTLQKQLDIVFPGLSLLGATAESFKIPNILCLRRWFYGRVRYIFIKLRKEL